MKKNISAGLDKIPIHILQSNMHALADPIAYVINLSISTGIVPNKLKEARVSPIYKSGDKLSTSNYRPISVLPSISKVLEKIISMRLFKFLDKNNILSSRQFGFRPGYSTYMAALDTTNYIMSGFDNKQVTVGDFPWFIQGIWYGRPLYPFK